MYKLFIAGCCPVFVLLSGLVSCSPDKKVTDVYTPAAPSIVSPGGRIGLREWDRAPDKTLDVQDSLDFADSRPTQLVVRTQCRQDGHDYYDQFALNNVSDVHPFQIMPEEVLLRDLQLHRVECSFELNLFNGNGSNHIFNLPSVPVSDHGRNPVSVAIEPPPLKPDLRLSVSLPQTPGVFVRYANTTDAATAQVVCADARVAPLPFHSVLELNDFDFAHAQPREDQPSDVLLRSPAQLCRVKIFERMNLVQISDAFQIRFPLQLFVVTVGALPLSDPYSTVNLDLAMNIMDHARPLVIVELVLRNPENVRRYIRLRKTGINISIIDYVLGPPRNRLTKTRFLEPWLYLQSVTPPTLIDDNTQSSVVVIEAQGTLRLRAIVQPPGGPLACNSPFHLAGVSFEGVDAISVQEVSSERDLLWDVPLPLPQPLLLLRGIGPSDMPGAVEQDGNCHWG